MLKSLHQNSPESRERKHTVLYVMSEEDHKVFGEYKADRPFDILHATSGQEGLELLKENSGKISAIVMSFKMSDISGVDFLVELKRNLEWNYIPTMVITRDINENNLVESVNAGAFYYLERPISEGVFSSVLSKALKDFTTYVFYLSKAQNIHISRLVTNGQFRFRTFKEAYEVADWLASLCFGKSRDDIVVGFIELLINAIEHGNLKIDYDEKSRLMKEGNYLDRLVERLELPEFKDLRVTVDFDHKSGEELLVKITDEGEGFDHEKYMVVDRKRLFHAHGKGILMAKSLYFTSLSYNDKGNEVTVTIDLS
jgi:response regulator RpfG family c-di-GMP phosphodiesterase